MALAVAEDDLEAARLSPGAGLPRGEGEDLGEALLRLLPVDGWTPWIPLAADDLVAAISREVTGDGDLDALASLEPLSDGFLSDRVSPTLELTFLGLASLEPLSDAFLSDRVSPTLELTFLGLGSLELDASFLAELVPALVDTAAALVPVLVIGGFLTAAADGDLRSRDGSDADGLDVVVDA